jgi:hypothetical protein
MDPRELDGPFRSSEITSHAYTETRRAGFPIATLLPTGSRIMGRPCTASHRGPGIAGPMSEMPSGSSQLRLQVQPEPTGHETPTPGRTWSAVYLYIVIVKKVLNIALKLLEKKGIGLDRILARHLSSRPLSL